MDLASAGESRFHVLAVDDSLLDRKLIERLLKCSSFQDDEKEVSLIITDYCMPEMTGYDLLRKIKESAALRNIPVVIMSSENVPSRINRCLEEGAEELLKPVQLSNMDRLKPHMMKQNNSDQNRHSCSKMTTIMEEIHSPDKPMLGFDGMKLVAS